MKDFKKYLFVFLITCGIFAAAWYTSNYFNNKKIDQIKNIQDQVTVDIMSSETQYSLLEELSCADQSSAVLSDEISSLADKINYAEQTVASTDQVTLLKEQYTILEVKDFLLNKQIAEHCGKTSASILYFYGDATSCTDCEKEGYVLDAIRQQYPDVRVYSFDYGLDLSTIHALETIYKIGDTLPALVINGKTVNGFQTVDQVTALLPKSITNVPKIKTPISTPTSGTSSSSSTAL